MLISNNYQAEERNFNVDDPLHICPQGDRHRTKRALDQPGNETRTSLEATERSAGPRRGSVVSRFLSFVFSLLGPPSPDLLARKCTLFNFSFEEIDGLTTLCAALCRRS
jgi:hypothetical protein